MTPEELAGLHPTLYHVTFAGNAPLILESGLHPTETLVAAAKLSDPERQALVTTRRRATVSISHPDIGAVTLNDNRPIAMEGLAACLDDGLTPEDWLGMLNKRVFFFTKPIRLDSLHNAVATRSAAKVVLAFDTLKLARRYAELMEIAPINTGYTMRKPVRRGLATFAPLLSTDYPAWRRRRAVKSLDAINEVAIRGSVLEVSTFLVHEKQGTA